MKKTPRMEVIELRHGKPLEQLLRERFEAGMPVDAIAREFGISIVTFYDWLDRLQAVIERHHRIRFAAEEDASGALQGSTPVA